MFFMFVFIGKDNSAPHILLQTQQLNLLHSHLSLNLVLFNNIWSSKPFNVMRENILISTCSSPVILTTMYLIKKIINSERGILICIKLIKSAETPKKSHPFKLQVDHFHTSRECAVHIIHLFLFTQ